MRKRNIGFLKKRGNFREDKGEQQSQGGACRGEEKKTNLQERISRNARNNLRL